VLDLLITSNLLARAERAGKAEQLRTFPKLRKAARTMASAVEVLMSAPEATEDRLVSLVEVWKAIEEVVPREKLVSAVETVAAFVPVTDDDAAAQWRAELVKRYRTVQGFVELLLEMIRFRASRRGRSTRPRSCCARSCTCIAAFAGVHAARGQPLGVDATDDDARCGDLG
jgi:hypothetical protein